MLKQICILYTVLLVISGCSIFRAVPVQDVKGDDVVLVLFNDKQFKIEVVGKLTSELSEKGYKVVTGSVKQAKYCNSADYGAVVYMAEYWMWHTPWHAKRYYRKNKEAENIILIVTSGDPDVVITKPFDAVTTASKSEKVGTVAQEILVKLENILQ